MMIDLEFSCTLVIESMRITKSGIKNSLLVIKNEFSSDSLAESSGMMEEKQDLTDLEAIFDGGLMLKTNETAWCSFPRNT